MEKYIVVLEGPQARTHYGPYDEHDAHKFADRFVTRADQLGLSDFVDVVIRQLKMVSAPLDQTIDSHVN